MSPWRARWQQWRAIRQNRERPWREVPMMARWGVLLLLMLQLVLAASLRPPPQAQIAQLPPPLEPDVLSVMALSDPQAAQRGALLWLQAFDAQPGVQVPLRKLDVERLVDWLDAAHRLELSADYAVFLAANIYFAVESEALRRAMLGWVRQRFAEQPATRWREMAQLAVLTRRYLDDVPLALALAREVRTQAADVALDWALQLEAFLLAGHGDVEAAAALLAMFLRDGLYRDDNEARFLAERLEEWMRQIEDKPGEESP